MADTHKNFAKGTLTNAPGTSGTSFVLSSGEGALFAANMPVTIVPDQTQPDSANAEIGYVTNVSSDTLTVTRAQESTSAKNAQIGWLVLGTVTAKSLTDIEADVTALETDSHTHSNKTILDATTASFTTADETKLDGIEASADVTDATNVASAGAFMISGNTYDDIAVGLVAKEFTISEKSKLAGIESGADVNEVTLAGSETLTNKNLSSGTNTFPTLNQNTTGSAATLTTSRTFRTNLASTSTASFNGSANVTPGVTGTLPVGNGGTGTTTFTGILKGNGTSAVTAVTAPSGDIVGTSDTQTLSAKSISGSTNTITNIGPSSRTGGFFIGVISGATLGSTGNKAITGVGFTPKLVRFVVLESNATSFPSLSDGAMTASSQYARGIALDVGVGANARWSTTSACISRRNQAGTVNLQAAYVSMDAGGFTINVTTSSSSFDVAYECYG